MPLCPGGEASGGLLLDSQPGMRRGGSRGDVLQGGIDSSLLLKAIQYTEPNLEMPPTGKLPQDTIDDFRKWIEEGAFDPRIEPTSLKAPQGVSIQQRAESHWAYQPLHSVPVPNSGLESTHHPIDRFILDRLQRENLPLNPLADKATLIRRLYFDLLGLPPSIEEIQAFEADDTSSSYDLLVDRLLSSPHFGERMARYWMDLARYADTKGYVFMEDRAYPHAYRYRDCLIRAWNQDLPYDRFVQLQVAADRLDPENVEGHLDAMGFLTLGRRFLNNPNDIADDRIDVVSRGILGMTVGCARCHDHKYDPISMADYYSLHGAFVNSEEPGGDQSPLRLTDKADIHPSFIFVRGQPGNRGESIEPRFVQFLNRDKPVPLTDGSGRGDLAKALVDPNKPTNGPSLCQSRLGLAVWSATRRYSERLWIEKRSARASRIARLPRSSIHA